MSYISEAVAAIKSALQPLEAEGAGVVSDFTTELSSAAKQLPTLVVDVVTSAVDTALAAAPSANWAAIVASAEASALSTFVTQGYQMLEADYVAFKGLVLMTIANKQATASAPVAAEADPTTAVE